MAAWTCTCVLALAGVASAGRVRQANSGVPVQGLRGTRSPVKFSPDDDQAVMTAFLVELGFTQYATADFVSRLDEELACDSIEDLATLHDDEEYRALGISNEDAEKIGTAAQVELVKRFLLTIPHENGTMTGYYAKFTQVLYDAGYEEVDDIEDLEPDEAKELGMTRAEVKLVAAKAEEWGAREVFNGLMWRFEENGAHPFREEPILTQMVDALLKAGLRTLEDVGHAATKDVEDISAASLAKLQASPLVLESMHKQEL